MRTNSKFTFGDDIGGRSEHSVTCRKTQIQQYSPADVLLNKFLPCFGSFIAKVPIFPGEMPKYSPHYQAEVPLPYRVGYGYTSCLLTSRMLVQYSTSKIQLIENRYKKTLGFMKFIIYEPGPDEL